MRGADGVGRPPGQRGAFRRGEHRQQRVGDQGVAEGVPVGHGRIGNQELGVDAGAQVAEERAFVEPENGADGLQGELASEHGGQVQHLLRLGTETRRPLRDAAGDVRGHVVAGRRGQAPRAAVPDQDTPVEQVAEQLLDHEGDAVGVAGEPVGDGAWQCAGLDAEAGGGKSPHVLRAEGAQGDGRRGPPDDRGAAHVPRGVRARLQGGEQEGRLVGEVVGEVLGDGQGLGVGVVQVVEDQEAAAVAADDREQAEHGLREHDHRLPCAGCRVLAPVGDEAAESGAVGREIGVVERYAARAGQREQRLGDRPERHRRADRAPATAKHHHALLRGVLGALSHEPCLADAGVSEDEDGVTAPVAGGGQPIADQFQLVITTDKDR